MRTTGPQAECVVDNQGEENQERDYLPYDTGDHEIIPRFLSAGAVVCGRCDASANTLEDEGEDIADDEDPGVVFGAEAGEGGTELEDDVLEHQVDACCDESGGDDQAGDLDIEAVS